VSLDQRKGEGFSMASEGDGALNAPDNMKAEERVSRIRTIRDAVIQGVAGAVSAAIVSALMMPPAVSTEVRNEKCPVVANSPSRG
jgi:hypothetical protein